MVVVELNHCRGCGERSSGREQVKLLQHKGLSVPPAITGMHVVATQNQDSASYADQYQVLGTKS